MSQVPREESNVHLLAHICRLNHTRVRALWNEIGLYRGQPFLLRALWEEEGITHSALAARLHRTPATITNMIKRMEKAGFVERRPDPEDQRISRVYLTEAGRAIQEEVQRVWNELEKRAFAGFTLEERLLLRRFLMQIRDNLGATPEPPAA